MLVLAAVPPASVQRLRAAGAEDHTFLPVARWGDALEMIRTRPVEMAVVDPLLGGKARTHEIERLRVLFPSLPLVVYTTLAPETAAVMLALGRLGIRRALFARFDDAPVTLREALREEREQTAARHVMQALSAAFEPLPSQLRWAIESTLEAPADTPTVTLLADRARLGRRTCERWFERSGLPSPRTVLMVARLLYAHRLLLDPGYTVEDVALRLGYAKARTLQAQLREVFELTAGEVRLMLTPEEAMQAVLTRYFPHVEQVAS